MVKTRPEQPQKPEFEYLVGPGTGLILGSDSVSKYGSGKQFLETIWTGWNWIWGWNGKWPNVEINELMSLMY